MSDVNKTYRKPPQYSYTNWVRECADVLSRKIPDNAPEVTIDFTEACLGKEVSVTVDGELGKPCGICKGTGVTDKMCTACAGEGYKSEKAFLFIRKKAVCEVCSGTGRVPNPRCPTCEGKGYTVVPQPIKVHIPPGTEDGQAIFMRYTHVFSGGTQDGLWLKIRVRSHPLFRRDGYDIRIDQPAGEELLKNGGEITVPCIDGSTVIKVPKGTEYGTEIKLIGKGVRRFTISERGDMYIKLIPEVM